MHKLTDKASWKSLVNHYRSLENISLRELFSEDPDRGKKLIIRATDIYFDYSKQRVTDETIKLLINLAREQGLKERMEAMFAGDRINTTENRSVLHTALRMPEGKELLVDGINVTEEVHRVLASMTTFCDRIRTGEWKGFSGKPVRNIVNIGIGGSDLGPVMAYEALKYYTSGDMTFRFVSNIDGSDLVEALRGLNPDETLFIISSKTFTTLETLTNAKSARRWFLKNGGSKADVAKHFVAVSTNREKVIEFGIDPENMFGFWDWVGGRYSMDSAIGLSTMLAVGPEAFREMLRGFREMDEHFLNTPFEQNIPVIMGLLAVWNTNFLNLRTQAILPYDNYLKRFPAYLQQLTMESNGKSVTLEGHRVDYHTGPVYWGEPGTNGQHSFYQLIHQGTMIIPCDFIGFISPLNDLEPHHDYLMANMIAQGEALAFGKTRKEAEEAGIESRLLPHKVFEGNRPSSTFLLEKLTPHTLGKLVAMYEHTVFTQGVLWGINSFDQMGVELGKVLAEKIISELEDQGNVMGHDSSTNELIKIISRPVTP
ncbi:MAG: glucose-6-phosphate isomerase [Bacteroidales bacterium]|nr:glucose-6-phosphate isomerase [Bacteroidales bacterium]